MNPLKISERKEKLTLETGPESSAIVSMFPHPTDHSLMVAAIGSGSLYYIKTCPFKIQKQFLLFSQYCTYAIPFQGGICASSSSGELIFLDLSGVVKFRRMIHKDTLSSMVESEEYLITVGYDGCIKFLDKQSFETIKQIEIESPIWSALIFQHKIYTAGTESFSVSLHNFEVKKLKRFDHFSVFGDKLYACSDERGFSCLTTNSNSYIPCNFILSLKDRMMIFSEECVGELIHAGHIQWKCHRIKEIKAGTTITCGFYRHNLIILGDIQGVVYKIEINEEGVRDSSPLKQEQNFHHQQ